jgi:hypothetical protein
MSLLQKTSPLKGRPSPPSAWPLPSVAAGRQRWRAKLQSGDAGAGEVRGRSDGRRYPASLVLRMVREFAHWIRLWRRARAQTWLQGPGWTHASRATIPSAKSFLRLHDAVPLPAEERDHPAREEGKFTHKKKQYPRQTRGGVVENMSRFCPTKIGVCAMGFCTSNAVNLGPDRGCRDNGPQKYTATEASSPSCSCLINVLKC